MIFGNTHMLFEMVLEELMRLDILKVSLVDNVKEQLTSEVTTQQSQHLQKDTLPKFNSSPLKSYRNPIGQDRLPTTIFQG